MMNTNLLRKSVAILPLLWLAVTLAGCGGGGGGSNPPPPQTGSPPVDDNGTYVFDKPGMRSLARPYNLQTPYSDVIVPCTVTLQEGAECNLNTLPLLGMETAEPTVAQVMARVVVSHQWMGDRFKQVLENMPPQIRLMTRGLTAIVISYDVRPSFYTTQTGAIYLDPEGLWLTLDEKEVIDTTPDFRSEFGKVLDFSIFWRYTLNQEHVTRLPNDRNRTVDEIKYRMASLLFHELAHANDFFPPGQVFDSTVAIWRAVATSNRPSNILVGQFPLESTMMKSLARVSFLGATASETQKAYTPEDVAQEFPPDYASAYYSYSTDLEDLAMLFEEIMMLYSFDVDRDVAITNLPDSNFCDDYIVSWGQRNRVLEPAVSNRALFVVERILPEYLPLVENYLINRSSGPVMMVPGKDWCENRFLNPTDTVRSLRAPDSNDIDPAESLIPYL
jgi:hypothetical protein